MKSSSIKFDWVVKGDGEIAQEKHFFQQGLNYDQLIAVQQLLAPVLVKFTELEVAWGMKAMAEKAKGNG